MRTKMKMKTMTRQKEHAAQSEKQKMMKINMVVA
jgi:hypothetical protein